MFELSNKSKYNASRTMLLTCPICFGKFHRPPSHAARVDTCYCSRACSGLGRRIRIEAFCIVCDKSMGLKPSDIPKIKTCSAKCKGMKMRKHFDKAGAYSSKAYKNAQDEVFSAGVCVTCGTETGPWIAVGIKAVVTEKGEAVVSIEGAALKCQHCHLSKIAPSGAKARHWRPSKKGS